MLKRGDVYIRDPFIIKDEAGKNYYMFGTTDRNCWRDQTATGFDYYKTRDLENFVGPYPAFRPPKDFWADRNFWAPEVHEYQGKYYLFATFIADAYNRGTQILVSDNLTGPYLPHSEKALTPSEWMALDGTFFLDDSQEPWMVFCHEWVQIYDGTICAVKLTKDLKRTASAVRTLFAASEAPWTRSIREVEGEKCFVTDGPFLYRTKNNKLLMLWSSFVENNTYAIGISYSESGEITGPWSHEAEPLYALDAGHGMLFRTFDERLLLAIHTPNEPGKERPLFVEVKEREDRLYLDKKELIKR